MMSMAIHTGDTDNILSKGAAGTPCTSALQASKSNTSLHGEQEPLYIYDIDALLALAVLEQA